MPLAFLSFLLLFPDTSKDIRQDIQTLLAQGKGSITGRAAWDRLSKQGPDALPLLLEGMNTKDTVALNWLRTAFDHIVDRSLEKGGKDLPLDPLLAFARDPKRQGRARRLALELVDKLKPGTSAPLYPAWLEDPEFRYEAVALQLEKAQKLLKDGPKDQALAAFQTTLAASRDVQQARDAAAGLLELGREVSVAQHLGFLTDWYLIGPFDAMGQKGFRTTYPPEKKVDLQEELAGQGKKVRWVYYQAQEASPRSGAKHQVLINLREKKALGDADDAVAFAYTAFTVPRAQEVEFRGAADDNFTVWVNGQRAFGFEEYRNGVRLDRHRFKVQLQEGKNTILVKICQTPTPNPEPNWEFLLRVVDETGKGIEMKTALPQ
jgi:hypothetical protein